MAIKHLLLSLLVIVLPNLATGKKSIPAVDTGSLSRASFPKGFIFGTASAAYQYEGAANKGGRGPSNWDIYTHQHPERIRNRSNADIAVDQYHRYKEDIKIMKHMNLDAYRFSIAWSRVLPKGKLSGGVNQKGIKYYNNLIDSLLAKNITPFVTIFHWDIPQPLEDEYRGFLSHRVVNDFRDYANVVFKEFGDRVKHWITLNEPWSYSHGGYATGEFAPGHCSSWQNLNCTGGDSGTEPYLASHYQLLAHAAAVELYKTKYQASQKGVIGITLLSHWFVPYSNSKADQMAAQRSLDFMFGWYIDTLTKGDYPESMRNLVGSRLPKFTVEESKKLKGSFDFLGVNYYTTYFARDAPHLKNAKPSYLTDALVDNPVERFGNLIGPRSASDWLYIYPRGIRDLLLYIKKKYNNPTMFITENGMDEENDAALSLEEALVDTCRVDFYYRHLFYLLSAIKDGAKVKGYFAWSLLDNFEWNKAYTKRFGLNYVDYNNKLERYPKLSAHWFKNFLKKR